MRKAITCIVLAAACSSTSSDPPIEEPDPDPACVEEETPSVRSEELAWDLDRDPASDAPICPADNPGCDAVDDDTPEIDLEEEPMWESDLATWGLTDPLTSTGRYRAWPGGRIPYVLATTNGVVQ